MGGLVRRTFRQNPYGDPRRVRKHVDKFFPYATPHNGIDLAGVNIPSWLTANDIRNFNRDYMARYLAIDPAQFKKTRRVDWMPEGALPSRKVFCLVGTNRMDSEPAMGLSRAFAGHGSDGLVRIENAIVCSADGDATANPTAKAFVYRSHSGHYGIVNSEEAYQNLVRFLFGDVRVDLWLDIEGVRVPQELEGDDAAGKVNALYQIEVLASPRGKRWYLTRRVAEEDSVACRDHSVLKKATARSPEKVYLSTVFLAKRYKVTPQSDTLAYSVTLAIRVPDYEISKQFWPDRHYEGEYLFRDSVVIELKPPEQEGGDWQVSYDWQSDNVGQGTTPISPKELKNGKVVVPIPFATVDATPPRSPGVTGKLRFIVSLWNPEGG